MGLLERVAEYAKWISAIFALTVNVRRPVRELVFGFSEIGHGDK